MLERAINRTTTNPPFVVGQFCGVLTQIWFPTRGKICLCFTFAKCIIARRLPKYFLELHQTAPTGPHPSQRAARGARSPSFQKVLTRHRKIRYNRCNAIVGDNATFSILAKVSPHPSRISHAHHNGMMPRACGRILWVWQVHCLGVIS